MFSTQLKRWLSTTTKPLLRRPSVPGRCLKTWVESCDCHMILLSNIMWFLNVVCSCGKACESAAGEDTKLCDSLQEVC